MSFYVCDVGIYRDPSTLSDGAAFDRDPATVLALALNVMRLKCEGLPDPRFNKGFGVLNRSVFAALGQIPDGV